MSICDMFIPDSHKGCTLDNFDWKGKEQLKPVIQDLAEGKRKGLVLIGDPGVGKTHLMVGTFKYMVENGSEVGSDVIYLSWSSFIQEIMDSTRSGASAERIVDLLDFNFLILDDIRPMVTRIWNDVLKRIIEKVYESGKLVMISTNAESPEDLSRVWNIEDYWMSRLVSVADIVKVRGKDRRVQ